MAVETLVERTDVQRDGSSRREPIAGAGPRTLVYIHIPKCAGSTVRNLMVRNFGQRLERFYTDRRGEFLPDDEMLALVSAMRPDKLALSGHDLRPLPSDVAARHGIDYFTFLRDPLKRAISLYHYERKITRKKMPDHISQAPFEEYLRERPKYDRAISNWQVHNLSEAGIYEAAREALESFLVVGLVEAFDESLILLREAVHWRRLRIGYRKANVSEQKVVSLDTLPPPVRRALEELNEEDLRLHAYARRRLRRELREVRRLRGKLALLRWRNKLPLGL